ncbi:MAG: hypothetical protein NDJ89_19180 [Oligoflexia bacterium]|nr:hypothetical protein [Oligoflexia bacterium]
MVASTPGVVTILSWHDSQTMEKDRRAGLAIPGSRYTLSLAEEERIPAESKVLEGLGASSAPIDAWTILKKHRQSMDEWIRSRDWSKLPRLKQLRSLGFIHSDEDAMALSDFAMGVIAIAAQKNPSADLAMDVEREWGSALTSAALPIKKPTLEELKILSLLFTPPMRVTLARASVGGKVYDDLELLAGIVGRSREKRMNESLVTLRSVFAETDPMSLVVMAMQAIEQPEIAKQKEERWRASVPNGNGETPSFTRRPDFPALSALELHFDRDGTGKNPIVLTDELSYWELIWKDSRFSALKNAVETRRMIEESAIQVAITAIGDLNQLYDLARRKVNLSDEDLCELLGNSASGSANTLLSSYVSDAVERLRESRQIPADQLESCRLDLAEAFSRLVQSAAQASFGNQRQTPTAKELGELEGIPRTCPRAPRKCKEIK